MSRYSKIGIRNKKKADKISRNVFNLIEFQVAESPNSIDILKKTVKLNLSVSYNIYFNMIVMTFLSKRDIKNIQNRLYKNK